MSAKEKKVSAKTNFTFYKNQWIYPGIVIILVCIVYYRSLFNGLIDWDDYEYIVSNKLLYQVSWENIKALFASEKHITLALLSIAVQMKLTGLDAFYFHLLNTLLHCVNVLLVYYLSKQLSKNALIAIITAALFALHPTRVESVAWVMQRKDLLYTLFFLLSLITYVYYIEKKEKKLYLIFLVIFFGWLSSVSKIQAFTLPVVLFLFDYYYGRKISVLSVLEKIMLLAVFLVNPEFNLYFLMVITLVVFTDNIVRRNLYKLYSRYQLKQKLLTLLKRYFIIRKKDKLFKKVANSFIILITAILVFIFFKDGFLKIASLWPSISSYWERESVVSTLLPVFTFFDRIFLFSYSVVFYIFQFFYPYDLCAMHPYPDKVNGLLPWVYYASAGVLLLFVLLLWFFIKKNKPDQKTIVFGIMFFLFNIFLVSHILPMEGRLIAADRYSYLACFGLFFLAGYLINRLVQKKNRLTHQLVLVSLVLLLFSYSVYSYSRMAVWKSTETFWTHVIKKQPQNYYAYFGLGNYFLEAKDYEKAIANYTKSATLNNKDAMVFNNLGRAFYAAKNYEESIENFTQAIELEPGFSQGYNNRGNAYYYLKDYNQAMLDYNTSLAKWSSNTDAMINKADLETELGNYDSALAVYNRFISIDSLDPRPYYKIGVMYVKQAGYKTAIPYLNKALQLKPDYDEPRKALQYAESKLNQAPDSISADKNKAALFIDQGLAKARSDDYTAAIDLFTKAINADPQNALAYKNRGNAKAALKDYKGSIEDFTKSIDLNPDDAGTYLNRGNSRYRLDDKSACDDWKKAGQLGNPKAKDLLMKYCNE